MFPFRQDNQWMTTQISSSSDYPLNDHDSQFQNLFAGEFSDRPPEESSDVYAVKMEESYQKSVSNNAEHVDTEEKKMIHREVERERRKQMASLITNLRSLLPLELIKGKRSKADLLESTEQYIKHLRGKISELHIKRDTLRRLSDMSISRTQNENSNLCSSFFVVVNPFSDGLEIVISGCFREEGLQLSRVMRVLLEENIDVETCASTKVNERIFHTIQSKVVDSMRIDPVELQQKLYEACYS